MKPPRVTRSRATPHTRSSQGSNEHVKPPAFAFLPAAYLPSPRTETTVEQGARIAHA